MKYQINRYEGPEEDAPSVVVDQCFADGYSIWEREGEGLVMRFYTEEGELKVDADWPRKWNKQLVSAEALEWAKEWDVFASTEDMRDDDCTITVMEN